jgi:hypothetical protein
MIDSGLTTSNGPAVGKATIDTRDSLDREVAEFLRESFAMIPQVAGDDQRMKLWLKAREPMMLSYTKKLWVSMHASSKMDYCSKVEKLFNAVVTTKPLSVLSCTNQKELDALLVDSIPSVLSPGTVFTPDELEGREALGMLGGAIHQLLSPHLDKIRSEK